MGGLFGGKKKDAAAAQAAKRAAEEERKRKEKQERDQAYGARGQRLASALGHTTAYSKDSEQGVVEDEQSKKLGNSAMNYNLLNVKLG